MADNYSQFSEVIENLTDEEIVWLKEIPNGYIDDDITVGDVKEFFGLTQEHAEHYGVEDGFRFPHFDMKLNEDDRTLWLTDDGEWVNNDHLLLIVQKFIQKFRPDYIFKMTGAETCSKHRIGEFGGFWMVVSKDDFMASNTWAAADEAAEALRTGSFKT